jgi:hypothetical protein
LSDLKAKEFFYHREKRDHRVPRTEERIKDKNKAKKVGCWLCWSLNVALPIK